MLDNFWNSTDSCLRMMMCTKEEFKRLNSTPLRVCDRYGHSCSVNGTVLDLPDEPLLFEDYEVFAFTDKHVHTLNQANLSMQFTSANHFMQMMYRLILNPTKDVQDMVLKQLSTYPASFTGIHIRSGGKLANKQEASYWLKEKELPQLSSFINDTIRTRYLSKDVYLTTDSDKIDSYLRQQLPDIRFLVRPSIKRYHSTSNANEGALYDVYITTQSSSLLYTLSSKYSKMLIHLSKHKRFFYLPFKFRIAKSLADLE